MADSHTYTDEYRRECADTAFREIQNLTTNDYPTLASLLKNTSLVPKENGHEGEWFLKFDGDNLGFLDPLKFAASLLTTVKDAAGLIDVAKNFASGVNPLSANLIKTNLVPPIVNMQVAFTNDANIPNDTAWTFHSVRFDANGSEVSPASDLTVEGGKLSGASIGLALPTSTREGYEFAGWFTAAEGGKAINATADYTQVDRIYAQWTPSGELFQDSGIRENPSHRRPEAGGRQAVTGPKVSAGSRRMRKCWAAP